MQKVLSAAKSKLRELGKFIINKDLALAIVLASAVILLGLFIGWENNKVIPANSDNLAHYTQEPHNHLSFMANWDSPIYLRIAGHGYKGIKDTGFFPLYPLLVRSVNLVIASPLYSALAVSWAAFMGAIYFYLKLIKRFFGIKDNSEALKGVLLFVLFPSAIFLIAPYTEALFAMLALAAIYFALRRKCLPAALFTMLATATHIDGLFVLVLVGLILYEQKERLLKILTTVIIGSLGLVAYMVFLLARYHNPLEFISAQRTNGWLQGGYLHHLAATLNIISIIPLILIPLAILYWWSRKKSFAIYCALFLCIPLLGGQFESFTRYSLMAFPVQLMLFERFRNSKLAYPVILAFFAVFWSFFMLQYAGGYNGG